MAISVKSSGGGGVSSSDVTASSAQVLAGYSTITSDSNDEVISGTIPEWSGAIFTAVRKPTELLKIEPYSGEVITNGYELPTQGVSVAGDTSGIQPGTYNATYTLQSGYKWDDSTTAAVTVSLVIVQREMNQFSISNKSSLKSFELIY